MAATCTTDGKTEGKHCSRCNEILVAQNVIPASHIEGEWITDKEPNCTEDGSKHQVCSVCTATIKTEVIRASGHTSGAWVIDKEATYTESGSEHSECSACKKSLVTRAIPPLLTYKLQENDTYVITGYTALLSTKLILPHTYNGKNVSAIGTGAFANADITELVIPETVDTIAENAFSNCVKLSKVTFPNTIKKISQSSFDGCELLLTILSDNITEDTCLDDKSKIYVLSNAIQIKQNTTLTIAEGVYIFGNGNYIANYGTVICKGTENSPINAYNLGIRIPAESSIYITYNTFNFEYLNLYGGFFGGTGRADITLDHCSFYNSTEKSFFGYPRKCIISYCYFENWHEFYFMITEQNSDPVIQYCTFYKCGRQGSVICCFGYGGTIQASYNNFIESKGIVLELEGDGNIAAKHNWFGTDDESAIKTLIKDGNDDFSISNTVDYSDWLLEEFKT